MLIITSTNSEDGYSPYWHVECPECKRTISFYSIAPKECTNCKHKFDFEFHKLLKKEEERINYHIGNYNIC